MSDIDVVTLWRRTYSAHVKDELDAIGRDLERLAGLCQADGDIALWLILDNQLRLYREGVEIAREPLA